MRDAGAVGLEAPRWQAERRRVAARRNYHVGTARQSVGPVGALRLRQDQTEFVKVAE